MLLLYAITLIIINQLHFQSTRFGFLNQKLLINIILFFVVDYLLFIHGCIRYSTFRFFFLSGRNWWFIRYAHTEGKEHPCDDLHVNRTSFILLNAFGRCVNNAETVYDFAGSVSWPCSTLYGCVVLCVRAMAFAVHDYVYVWLQMCVCVGSSHGKIHRENDEGESGPGINVVCRRKLYWCVMCIHLVHAVVAAYSGIHIGECICVYSVSLCICAFVCGSAAPIRWRSDAANVTRLRPCAIYWFCWNNELEHERMR